MSFNVVDIVRSPVFMYMQCIQIFYLKCLVFWHINAVFDLFAMALVSIHARKTCCF